MKRLSQRRFRLEQVFAVIEQAAEAGAPFPSNDVFVERTCIAQPQNVGSCVNDLEADGLIIVHRKGPFRRAVIAATGKETEWSRSIGRPKHSGRPSRQRRIDGVDIQLVGFRGDLPPERYVVRDPCTYCGVRRDVGCEHYPSERVAA